MNPTFEYGTARVRDLRVITGDVDKQGLPRVNSIEFKDELFTPTKRFWRSFFTRFRISDAMFRFFSYEEVFDRVTERAPSERFRYCIERGSKDSAKLLGG